MANLVTNVDWGGRLPLLSVSTGGKSSGSKIPVLVTGKALVQSLFNYYSGKAKLQNAP